MFVKIVENKGERLTSITECDSVSTRNLSEGMKELNMHFTKGSDTPTRTLVLNPGVIAVYVLGLTGTTIDKIV